VSLEKLYDAIRRVDKAVEDIYRRKEQVDAEIMRIVEEYKSRIQEEVERSIKSMIEKYRSEKLAAVEEEVKSYAKRIDDEVREFRRNIEGSLDKVVEEVLRLLAGRG